MHRKTLTNLALILVLLFPFPAVYSGDPPSKPQKSFFWKVTSKTATVYILGSIHILRRDVYPLPAKIEEGFRQAGVLVVEANINEINPAEMMTTLGGSFYPGEETLEDHLSRETFDLVKARLGELGVPIGLFHKNKPWIVALMITTMELQRLGYDPQYGIDKYFLDKAKGGKRVLELESAGYQLGLLNGLSDAEQELFLLYTLKDLKVLEEEASALVKAWSTGDVKKMESLVSKGLSEDPRLRPVYEKLLDDRNKTMVSKIEGFLKTGERYFVVIGAGHLVGEKGVIELLKRGGYHVGQL